MSTILQLQQLKGPDLEQLTLLYQETGFPVEVRYYCGLWIESQQWASLDLDSQSSEPAASMLLQQLIQEINQKSEELSGDDLFVTRLKLKDFANDFYKNYRNNPLKFVRVVRHCLESEWRIIEQSNSGVQGAMEQAMPVPDSHQEIESVLKTLKFKTQVGEKQLSDMRQKQELFVVKYQEFQMIQSKLSASQQQFQGVPTDNTSSRNEEVRLNQRKEEMKVVINRDAQHLMALRMQMAEHHREIYMLLAKVQSRVLKDELNKWKRQQQLAGIGGPQEGSLDTLQSWCESLAEIIWQNRQQIMHIEILKTRLPLANPAEDPTQNLNSSFTALLSALVPSTFIIEKQPPQVLKKETKFKTSVRLLVGGKLNVHMEPPQVKATIISEMQAKALLSNENLSPDETSGEFLNNSGIMEYHRDTGILNVSFRNMSLKKIKRADRRGAEFVTEEKFTVLYQCKFTVSSGELAFKVMTLSLPVVVIVHGNQESNALATVLWDNAFAEPDRVPFVIPDKVPWPLMANALNSKFMAANGRSLSNDNLQYLAMKAFSNQSVQTDDFSNMYITWSNFNRDPLPGCAFTFWRWFHGVLELTRKHLGIPWKEGSILGFIRKEQAQELLLTKQTGTFLLRFSDSKIGAISITWVNEDPNTGERQVLNLLPFASEDFHIRSLADRIHDLPHLTHLFPDIPKDTAFGNLYTPEDKELPQPGGGYVSSVLVSRIPQLKPPHASYDAPGTPMSGSVEPASPQQQLHNPQDFDEFNTFDDYDQEDSMVTPDLDELLKGLQFEPGENNLLKYEMTS
ncbi:signal transducer and activator of transcription 5B-like isoform X2 [Asterias rubens]|uniref:signal transducer and activator of transcription 5B-like isoform X2 n=1 Tax=Asterias rubens TaxID=7604 RepID=UPI001455610E|nr:signal transducer and activator of transcription 5B-like isoform X2 [Asterias rubens]